MWFDSVKLYPNGLAVAYVAKFERKKEIVECSCELDSCPICNKVTDDVGNVWRTKRRIKAVVRDYALANDFKYFVTFTFKKQITDREQVAKKVRKWLDNYRQRKNKDVKYLIMFERHKKGGWHIHGLFDETIDLECIKPHIVSWKGNKKTVYSFGSWRFGFSRVERIEHRHKVASYILKYITKDVEIVGGGKNNYIASRNLLKPLVLKDIHIDNVDNSKMEVYEYCYIYKFATNDDVDIRYI